MKTYGLPLFVLFILAAVITLACGSPKKVVTNCGSYAGSNTTGALESVTVCPAVADAQQYPGGQVPFLAIGTYTTQPSPALIPTETTWGACQGEAATNDVTVSQTGEAKCVAGASGLYTVWVTGTQGVHCNVIGPCGACGPTGTAQLTCP
jgi:hypothetical protein